MGTTRKLLDRLPDGKFSWKPHEKSMSLGGLATHLANIPYWGDVILNHSSIDLSTMPPNLERENLSSLGAGRFRRQSSEDKGLSRPDRCRARLALDTQARRPRDLHSARVAAFRSFVLHHIIHHRGQLSVYLRLNDVPVPAIYGPSADEGVAKKGVRCAASMLTCAHRHSLLRGVGR